MGGRISRAVYASGLRRITSATTFPTSYEIGTPIARFILRSGRVARVRPRR